MKIEEHLSKEQKQQLNKLFKPEKLSRSEIKELMGMNMQTLKRVNGALRRK